MCHIEALSCCIVCVYAFVVYRAQETFLQWDQCRRLYNFVLADNMRKLILSHRWINSFCSFRCVYESVVESLITLHSFAVLQQ